MTASGDEASATSVTEPPVSHIVRDEAIEASTDVCLG